MESINVLTPLGYLNSGSDESLSYGNNIISVGETVDGNLMVDFSAPFGKQQFGTTIYYRLDAPINALIWLFHSIPQPTATPSSPYPVFPPLPIFAYP